MMELPCSFFIAFLSFFHAEGKITKCTKQIECTNSKYRFSPLCYCDERCFAYKDCCKGYYENHDPANFSMSTLQKSESCKLLTNQINARSERIGAFMVDRCIDTGSKCTVTNGDWNTMLPVSFGNTTYLNANCALCNNVVNFKHWKIAFVVDYENELRIKTGRLTSEEAIFNEIMSGSFAESLFYLQPPVLANIRFCPYDLKKDRQIKDDRFYNQKPIVCNRTLYKNEERCLEDGCCKIMEWYCSEFYLIQFGDDDTWSRGSEAAGLNMIIEFQPMKSETFVEDLISVERVTVGDFEVYVVIEMTALDGGGSQSLDDCVYGVITYLGKSPYLLFLKNFHYWVKTMVGESSHVFYFLMKSHVQLTLPMVGDLLSLQHPVHCDYNNGSTIAYGKVNTSTIYNSNGLLNMQDEQRRIEDLYRNRKSPSRVIYPCGNLSFIVLNTYPFSLIEMGCLDEIPSPLDNDARGLYSILNVFYMALGILAAFVDH